MVAFDAAVLVLCVIVGLVIYPIGCVVLDYFSESYNTTDVAQGLGNPQVVAAALASIVVGNNRRAGG